MTITPRYEDGEVWLSTDRPGFYRLKFLARDLSVASLAITWLSDGEVNLDEIDREIDADTVMVVATPESTEAQYISLAPPPVVVPPAEPEPEPEPQPEPQPEPTTLFVKPEETGIRIPFGQLKPQSQMPALTANAVIEGYWLGSVLRINVPGVTFRDCLIESSPTQVIAVQVNQEGIILFDHCEMTGNCAALVGQSGFTASYCNIHHFTQDGAKGRGVATFDHCWIHDCQPEPGAHADGIQMQDYFELGELNIRNCYIDMGPQLGNSALFICGELPRTTGAPVVHHGHVIVTDNYLNGGNYTVFALDGDGRHAQAYYRFARNRFGRDHRYGPANVSIILAGESHTAELVSWEDNAYLDNGEPIEIGA
jgi:hypothetical protein